MSEPTVGCAECLRALANGQRQCVRCARDDQMTTSAAAASSSGTKRKEPPPNPFCCRICDTTYERQPSSSNGWGWCTFCNGFTYPTRKAKGKEKEMPTSICEMRTTLQAELDKHRVLVLNEFDLEARRTLPGGQGYVLPAAILEEIMVANAKRETRLFSLRAAVEYQEQLTHEAEAENRKKARTELAAAAVGE